MPDVRPGRDLSGPREGGSRLAARQPGRPVTPFGRLATTHAVNMAAEAFTTIALAGTLFFTVSPTDARPRVALFLALTMAPFAVVAPILGPIIDRPSKRGRRLFVFVTAAGRAVLVFLMARHRNTLLLFPEAFGVLVLSKGYSVAKSALVPSTVEDQGALVEANSRLALVAVVAGFAGGIPAAGILQLLGSQWVLLTAMVMYGVMAATALRLPKAVPRRPGHEELERAELRRPTIFLSATAMAVLRGGVGFLTFFLAFALKDAGEPAWFYGAVLAASAAGGFIGAVGAPPVRRRIREEAILLSAMLIPAAVALFAARSLGRPLAVLTALALGAGAGAGKLAFDSLVQRDAPDADRGRAFARFETRFQLAWVVGGLLPVAIPMPSRVGYLILAVVLGFFALSYLGGLRATAHADRSDSGLAPP